MSVERTGPGGVVARVTLNRPDVHNAFNAELIGELRQTFHRMADEKPDKLRAVVLAGDGPSFCAGADVTLDARQPGPDARAERAGRDGDGRDVRRDRPLPRAGDRARPGRGARRRDGPVRGERPRHRRGGRQVRLHRDAPRHPARGHQPVRHRQDRRDATPARCSPAAGASTPRARCASGWSTRSSRARQALDAAVENALADVLAAGPTAARAAKAIIREVRGLPHESTRWHTARRIAGQRTSAEGQEGLRAFLEKREPDGKS